MNPVMVFQPVSKFGMFDFVVSYTVCFIVFFFLDWWSKQNFWIFWGRTKKTQFTKKGGRTNHPWMKLWYRGKGILIKKVFHLTQKENIEKTKEVLRKPGRPSLPL